MDKSLNLSFLVLKSVGEFVGGTPQFIDDEHAILIDVNGEEICKFTGMLFLEVNGHTMKNVCLHNVFQIAEFIKKWRK